MDVLTALGDASPIVIVLTFMGLFLHGDVISPRERDAAKARAEELRTERNEWQRLALDSLRVGLDSLRVGERIVDKLPERRDP